MPMATNPIITMHVSFKIIGPLSGDHLAANGNVSDVLIHTSLLTETEWLQLS